MAMKSGIAGIGKHPTVKAPEQFRIEKKEALPQKTTMTQSKKPNAQFHDEAIRYTPDEGVEKATVYSRPIGIIRIKEAASATLHLRSEFPGPPKDLTDAIKVLTDNPKNVSVVDYAAAVAIERAKNETPGSDHKPILF